MCVKEEKSSSEGLVGCVKEKSGSETVVGWVKWEMSGREALIRRSLVVINMFCGWGKWCLVKRDWWAGSGDLWDGCKRKCLHGIVRSSKQIKQIRD